MKKALSVLLTAAMAASMMAGCGSSSDGAASGTTTDNGAAAGTESAGATAADGAAFKIGGIGPTTGAAAIYGTAVMNGAQIAVDEINAAGGINGYQIAYKFEDDQHDAEKSVNAYNSLKDWGLRWHPHSILVRMVWLRRLLLFMTAPMYILPVFMRSL